MDNDTKHVSVETLKWYSSCEIEIETCLPHSPDINPLKCIGNNQEKAQGT